jgi:hypothetical protein
MFKEMNLPSRQHKAGNLDDEDYQHHIKLKDEARRRKSSDKVFATNDPSVKVLRMDFQSCEAFVSQLYSLLFS